MATLAPQVASIAGLDLTFAATDQTNGDEFASDERTMLVVRNTTAGAINLTIVTPGTVDGLAIEDRVIAVPAGPGLVRYYGLGSATAYVSSTTMRVKVTAAAVGLELAMLRAS